MKNLFYTLFLIIGVQLQAQLLEQVTLKDYGLVGNVIEVQETESSLSAANVNFANADIFKYQFDVNGYITKTEKYGNSYKMSYSKGYVQQIEVSGTNKVYTNYIIKTPARSFLTNTNDVIKNSNGTVQKVIAKPASTSKDALDHIYDFSYEATIIKVKSSGNFPNTQRFTKEGLILSEENSLAQTYFFYHPKSKQLTQKISKTKYSTIETYFIYSYEYDKYGNWIVCYSYSALPSISNKIAPFAVSTRSIKYKNDEITGYATISDAQKARASYYNSNKIVNKLDTANPYTLPDFIDYDFTTSSSAASSVEVANTPGSPMAPVTTKSSCQGNCVDGYGKYTYDNGYYEGFWTNGQKEGYGLYAWKSGEKYTGNWVNGQMSGTGSTDLTNGDVYVGGYKNNKFEGESLYFVKANNKFEYNSYQDGRFLKSIAMNPIAGNVTGCAAGNCSNGYGFYRFTTGDIYYGNFVNGAMRRGMFVFKNGDSYIGEFNSANRFEGYGSYNFKATGDFYRGNWNAGKYEGRGFGFFNKKEVIGEFKNGVLATKMN